MTDDGASVTSQREQDDFEGAAVRRRMSTRIGAIVGAVALAGGLAACSGGTPGAAAVVDGTRIDIATVDEATAQIGDLIGQYPQANLTLALAQGVVLHSIAEENGFAAATDDEAVAEQLDASYAEAQLTPPDEPYNEGALLFGRLQLEANRLTGQVNAQDLFDEFNASFGAADTTYNPRWLEQTDEGEVTLPTVPWIVASDAAATTATAE